MPDYQLGKIYKVKGGEECYIGSTADKLSARMNGHRNNYKSFLKTGKGKITLFNMFEKYGLEECKIELMEDYPCNNKTELKRREGEVQAQTDNRVNHNVAGRTKKETYQEQNKKNLVVTICSCGGKVSNINKKKHLSSKKHKNHITNNESINIDSDELIICPEIIN